jgi:hypothetical protein
MFAKIMIASIATVVVVGVASAQEWQPSWAADPIPLVNGAEYKTGSPLSQPGLGLFGGIANVLTGGNLPQFTGGGSIIWQGQTATCAGLEINGECMPTMTPGEASTAQDGIDWSTVANAQRVTVPGVDGRACNKSKAEQMEMAIKLYDQGITSFDCDGNPIEHATVGNCAAGERLTVAYIEDETLGARAIYTCEVK